MAIPYYVFLLVYGVFVLFFLIFTIFDLYHMFKFGFWDVTGFIMTFIFIGGGIIILFLTWQYGSTVDWYQTFNIFGGTDLINATRFDTLTY